MSQVGPSAGEPQEEARRRRFVPRCAIALVLACLTTGCESLRPGVFVHPEKLVGYQNLSETRPLEPSASAMLYRKVQQASSRNAIVLQVLGDDVPVRVLPLPADGKTVFVSDLLGQTGVLAKLESIEATLFRNSAEALGGVRMEVKMSPEGDAVRPESDYALQPGDRLRVQKRQFNSLEQLLKGVGL